MYTDRPESLLEKLKSNQVSAAIHYLMPSNKQLATRDDSVSLLVGDSLSEKVFHFPMHVYSIDSNKVINSIGNFRK